MMLPSNLHSKSEMKPKHSAPQTAFQPELEMPIYHSRLSGRGFGSMVPTNQGISQRPLRMSIQMEPFMMIFLFPTLIKINGVPTNTFEKSREANFEQKSGAVQHPLLQSSLGPLL